MTSNKHWSKLGWCQGLFTPSLLVSNFGNLQWSPCLSKHSHRASVPSTTEPKPPTSLAHSPKQPQNSTYHPHQTSEWHNRLPKPPQHSKSAVNQSQQTATAPQPTQSPSSHQPTPFPNSSSIKVSSNLLASVNCLLCVSCTPQAHQSILF